MHGIEADGDSFKIKYSLFAVLTPVAAVIIYLFGWISSHAVFRGEITNLAVANTDLKALIVQSQSRENALHEAMIADRIASSNRLVSIEGDIKRIVQDVAEIKAFPKTR